MEGLAYDGVKTSWDKQKGVEDLRNKSGGVFSLMGERVCLGTVDSHSGTSHIGGEQWTLKPTLLITA